MCLPIELTFDCLALADGTKGGGVGPIRLLSVSCCAPEVPSPRSSVRIARLRYMLSNSSSLEELCQ